MNLNWRRCMKTIRNTLHNPTSAPNAERLLEKRKDEQPPRLYVG